ncbi:hypothetical protein V8E55_008088 [Tylopilus felleus]
MDRKPREASRHRTGTGVGGESFYGEPFEDEVYPPLRFSHRGLVVMANNGTENSNESHFVLRLRGSAPDRANELHGKYTLFGRVVDDTLYTAEEHARQRDREAAQREREEAERRKGAKKNASDGDAVVPKQDMARPDLIDDSRALAISMPDVLQPSPPSQKGRPGHSAESTVIPPSKDEGEDTDVSRIRGTHAQDKASSSETRRSKIEKMGVEIQRPTRRREGGEDSDEEAKKKAKTQKSYLAEELAKYSKVRGLHKKGKGRKDEEDRNKAERDYVVIDPRQRSARAREEERETMYATTGKGRRARSRR